MPRTKSKKATNGTERGDNPNLTKVEERPAKKAKLLDDSDDDDDDNEDVGGVALKVNEEYARRFEHNKKRAERHRCEYHQLNRFVIAS